jgi:hypothetical protein
VHTLSTSFVLGYHGCDAKVAERLLAGDDFRLSQNDYAWLGHGVYFWEANPKRGIEFAGELKNSGRRPDITTPAVVGAVIDFGKCLDLTKSAGTQQAASAYNTYKGICKKSGTSLPRNSKDSLRRNLDCAVNQTLHEIMKTADLAPVDSVKGVLAEVAPAYPGSDIYKQTHIQICVKNPDFIKGVFCVPKQYLE